MMRGGALQHVSMGVGKNVEKKMIYTKMVNTERLDGDTMKVSQTYSFVRVRLAYLDPSSLQRFL